MRPDAMARHSTPAGSRRDDRREGVAPGDSGRGSGVGVPSFRTTGDTPSLDGECGEGSGSWDCGTTLSWLGEWCGNILDVLGAALELPIDF
jgi:hypothetical protein